MRKVLPLFLGACCLLSYILPVRGQVIFNEIMYHPASTNVLEDFVELYNMGAAPVDLTG